MKESSALVPTNYIAQGGYNIGNWVSHQRKDKKRGFLSKIKIARLDSLGFVWSKFDVQWDEGIEAFKSYIAMHNSALVKVDYIAEDGYKLGAWLQQRKTEKKLGRLSKERKTQLDALGFIWDDIQERRWNEGIEALKSYIASHNSVLVPQDYKTPDGFKLGVWLGSKIYERSQGKLSKERTAQLDNLGIIWDKLEAQWYEGFELFKAYIAQHNSVFVPRKYKTSDGFNLGAWLGSQRSNKNKEKLSKERIAKLDALGIIWDKIEAKWDEGIEALNAYIVQHNSVLVPAKYKSPDGYNLGKWVHHQRTYRKKETLSRERIVQLDALGFVWIANKIK